MTVGFVDVYRIHIAPSIILRRKGHSCRKWND